jgi:hypothetical protein
MNLLPNTGVNDFVDRMPSNPKLSRQLMSVFCISRVSGSNIPNLTPCEFRVCVSLASIQRQLLSVASFFNRVSVVVSTGTKPKVVWVHARRVVAEVKDTKALRNRTSVQNPASSMSADQFSSYSLRDRSVTKRLLRRIPNPTGFSFSHLLPKAIREVFGKSLRGQVSCCNLWAHNQFVWLCRALGCVNTVRAFSFCQIGAEGQG